jgi:hypothetical protein
VVKSVRVDDISELSLVPSILYYNEITIMAQRVGLTKFNSGFGSTCISNFMFRKSTPTLIFLRFTFIQIQVVFVVSLRMRS